MKTLTDLRKNINNGKPSIGTWMQIPSPEIAEILSATKYYDWIVIDMEHGTFSRSDIASIIRAIEIKESLPFVRLQKSNKTSVKNIIDFGFKGFILPMIESKNQLIEIKNELLYPPLGKRGVGFSRSNQYGINFEKAIKNNERPFLVGMIETKGGLDNINEILNTDFLDAIIIGPYDLSASLGVCGDFESIIFKEAYEFIKNQCFKKNINFGIHIVEPSNAKLEESIRDGCKFIAYSIDSVILHSVKPTIN